MNQTTEMLYKLMVLYLLNRVSFPLTRTQIGDFIVEKEYTDYLTLQQVFAELREEGYITEETAHNRTLLTITEEGRESLSFFGNRIGNGIRKDMEEYLAANKLRLRNETSIKGSFYQDASGEYVAELTATDKNSTLVKISLAVPTKELAEEVMDHWQDKNEEIYQYITKALFT